MHTNYGTIKKYAIKSNKMVFGLGSKKTATKANKEAAKSKKTTATKASSSQAAEAAAVLKKMEDKKKSGECAFC